MKSVKFSENYVEYALITRIGFSGNHHEILIIQHNHVKIDGRKCHERNLRIDYTKKEFTNHANQAVMALNAVKKYQYHYYLNQYTCINFLSYVQSIEHFH